MSAGPRRDTTHAPAPSGAHPLPATVDLVAIMDRLRSPGGCPWDAAQTHASLARYLLEETYEVLEALDTADRLLLREELGDLLLQVVFHTRITTEDPDSPFGFDDVAGDVAAKLVRRHPHVFAPATREGREAARLSPETGWEQRKQVEKGRRSVFDGVPEAIPALLLATKMLDRLAAAPLDVPLPPAAVLADLPGDRAPAADGESERAVGAALLAVVRAARDAGVEPEQALRGELRRLRTRVAAVEGGPGRGGPGRGGPGPA